MNNPSTIIDIALVVVLVISVVRAYIDGFFTAILRIIGSLGSLFGGLYVASNYSQFIFDKLLRNSLITRSYSYLEQTARNIDIEPNISLGSILLMSSAHVISGYFLHISSYHLRVIPA